MEEIVQEPGSLHAFSTTLERCRRRVLESARDGAHGGRSGRAETQRRRPRTAAAAAFLLCAAVACRTPTAAGAAASASAPPPVHADDRRPAAPLVGTDDGRPAPIAPSTTQGDPEAFPRVLVMPSGDAFLVLGSGTEQLADAVAWHVVYLAGDAPEVLARPDVEARLASSARDLLEAFLPLAEVAQAQRVAVTAVFGSPGRSGATDQRWFARDAGRWRGGGRAPRRAVAQVPAFQDAIVRDRDEERSARDAAAGFVYDADRADYDAAWARTSALAKAVMSRVEFERNLAPMAHAGSAGDARLYLSYSAPAGRFLPGALIEAWLVRDAAGGPVVDALVLRFDDDMEWRVAGMLELTTAPAPAVLPGVPVARDVRMK